MWAFRATCQLAQQELSLTDSSTWPCTICDSNIPPMRVGLSWLGPAHLGFLSNERVSWVSTYHPKPSGRWWMCCLSTWRLLHTFERIQEHIHAQLTVFATLSAAWICAAFLFQAFFMKVYISLGNCFRRLQDSDLYLNPDRATSCVLVSCLSSAMIPISPAWFKGIKCNKWTHHGSLFTDWTWPLSPNVEAAVLQINFVFNGAFHFWDKPQYSQTHRCV